MDFSNGFIIGAILVIIAIGALVALFYFKKRNVEKLFIQTHEMAKQVPRQKKNSFLLLIFKESLSASKNKKNANSLATKLNNPKFLNIQLIQMSKILKNTSEVKDKKVKRALTLLDQYKEWEKAKVAKSKTEVQDKAS